MHSPDSLAQFIAGRRTHKRFDGSPLSEAQLEFLLELLRWAPNHRVTQPWRAYVLNQSQCHKLGSWIDQHREEILACSDKPDKDRSKIDKLLGYYFPSFGAIIQVTQIISGDPHQDREDYAAVCAGVQNMLLGAESLGLAHFWSSAALLYNPAVLRHLGIDPEHQRMVASLWLGGRVEEPTSPRRHDPAVYTTWIDQ